LNWTPTYRDQFAQIGSGDFTPKAMEKRTPLRFEMPPIITPERRHQFALVQNAAAVLRRRYGLQVVRHFMFWIWFVRHVVLDPEIRTQDRLLQLVDDLLDHSLPMAPNNRNRQYRRLFRAMMLYYYETCFSPHLSFELRLNIESGHVSVFSRVGSEHFQWLRSDLYGIFLRINARTYDRLRAQDFYSLYNFSAGVFGIMYGPLSFVSHYCGYPIHFSNVHHNTVDMVAGHADHRFLLANLPRRFRGVALRWMHAHSPVRERREHEGDHSYGIVPNREVFVQYTDDLAGLPFVCHCPRCVAAAQNH